MLLHATMLLYVIGSHYVTECYCMLLHVTVCYCMSLYVSVTMLLYVNTSRCYCMLPYVTVYHCMLLYSLCH